MVTCASKFDPELQTLIEDGVNAALEVGRQDFICLLLKEGLINVYHKVRIDDEVETLFSYAAKWGGRDIIDCILEHDNYKKEDAFSCMDFHAPYTSKHPPEFLKWDPEILAISILEPGSTLSIPFQTWENESEEIEVELKEGSMREVYEQIMKVNADKDPEIYRELVFNGITFKEDGKYAAGLLV